MQEDGDRRAENWVSVRHLQYVVARGEAVGLRFDELLRDAGLERARLEDADGHIPLSALESMLASVASRNATPLLGLNLASDIVPATFGPLGHLVQACNCFGDVLDALLRYNGLLSNIGKTTVSHAPGTVEVGWDCLAGGPLFRREATEYVLGAFVVLTRALLPEQRHRIVAVNFTHPPPANPRRNRAYFRLFRAPVHFNRASSFIVLPQALLAVRLAHGDALLKEALERHATGLLQQRRQEVSLTDEVRHLVEAMLADGAPGKDAVAMQLGMSARSLHRRLRAAGSSYRGILHQVRLARACAELDQGGVPVAAIARRLGFSSHQAFLRWFKQNTGRTPSQYKTEKAPRRL